jgi:uncharacterized membrane protein YsdA (DUF1294 family)
MKIGYLLIALLLAGLIYSYWFGYTPALIGLVYFLASIISYYLYAKDKKAAKNGMWRVPENTLHLSALLGGWPGSILGQQKLRHKTKKVSFRIVFFITLLTNLCLLFWLHTPDGSHKLYVYLYKVEYWVTNQFGSHVDVHILLKLIKFNYLR